MPLLPSSASERGGGGPLSWEPYSRSWSPRDGSLAFRCKCSASLTQAASDGLLQGSFATLGMILCLLFTDVMGLIATVQNYRSRKHGSETQKMILRFFGAIFVLMGVVVLASGLHSDRSHNFMHMLWGAIAMAASFSSARAAKLFCIGSGLFYLALALLGLTYGDRALGRAWQFGPMLLHTGDHIFHLVLGTVFLGFGLLPLRPRHYQEVPASS